MAVTSVFVVLALAAASAGSVAAASPRGDAPRIAALPRVVGTISVPGHAPYQSSPVYPVVSPDGKFAYITNASDYSTMIKINIRRKKLVGQVGVSSGDPGATAISPNGRIVYFAETAQPYVFLLRTNPFKALPVQTAIPVGTTVSGIALNKDGSRLYVANENSNSISVINTATRKNIRTIGVGARPSAIAVSPTSSRVYVTDSDHNKLIVVSTKRNKVLRRIAVGPTPGSVTVVPNGQSAYVANTNNFGTGPGTVSLVNLTSNRVRRTIKAGKNPVAAVASPDGSRVYVSTNAHAIWAISTRSNKVVSRLRVGSGPTGIAFSRNSKTAVVANSQGSSVSIVATGL